MKRIGVLETRPLLLGISSLLSLLITGYQLLLNRFVIRPLSPWIALFLIPLCFALVNAFLAYLDYKKNTRVGQILRWISRRRSLVSIISLSVLILGIYCMRIFVDPNDSTVNIGMSSIGLTLYANVLLILIFVFLRTNDTPSKRQDHFLIVTLLSLFSIWIIIGVTRFGLQPDRAFWNVAGVPVLWIFLACIILTVISIYQVLPCIQKKLPFLQYPKTKIWIEILLVFCIWLTASVIWINTPYSNSYFLTEALPPDGHYWPMSDARLMDLGGQYLIVGGKLETPYFTEKPYYALFLGLLHFFFGQSYQTVTNIQILLLAFIPVCLYLLGKEFSGRTLGLALAAFGIIKEMTAILSTYKISVSNSRLMMTEAPTALVLLFFTLLVVKWLKREKPGLHLPLIAGVTIGVGVFVRSNNIVVLFALLGFLLLTNLPKFRQRLPQIGLFLVGVLIAIVPWVVYSQVTYGKGPLTWKVHSALETRFSLDNDERDEKLSKNFETRSPTSTPQPSIGSPTLFPKTGFFEMTNDLDRKSKTVTEKVEQDIDGFYKSEFSTVLAHFLNNQVKVMFILPFQVYPAHLSTVLGQEYWSEPVTWNGKMPSENLVAFILNLVLIAFGLTYAWRLFSWVGIVPLLIEMSYYLSNALVRTSGSRYLVPVDWVVFTYYFLGIFEILRILKIIPAGKMKTEQLSTSSDKGGWFTISLALLIGFSLPVLNLAFPSLYHNETKTEVFERVPVIRIQEEVGISPNEMQDFFERNDSVFIYGREIYPGYQQFDQGAIASALTFTVITPKMYNVMIPYGLELTEKLPEGEDMIVIGCKTKTSDQVVAYLGYFIQSDKLIWSTTTTFNNICD